jgi:hypothetical protein
MRPKIEPGPALIIDEKTRSLVDCEIVELVDVQVIDPASEKVIGQKFVEPAKLAKVSFGKEVNEKVKKGTFTRTESTGRHVQIGAGKRKQVLTEYPLSVHNFVDGTEKAAAHFKTCTAYLDAMAEQYTLLEDRLTGVKRPKDCYVPRRFRVVDTGPCELAVLNRLIPSHLSPSHPSPSHPSPSHRR